MKTFKEIKELASKEWLIEKYFKEGLSQRKISFLLDTRPNNICDLFKLYSLECTNENRSRKYHYNSNYFKTWSANMAYILGFTVTDGNITQNMNTLRYSLQRRDSEITNFIAREICLDKYPVDTISNKTSLQSEIQIHNAEICKDLFNIHSIFPAKSGKEILQTNIPLEFIPDYLRGIIDGDGSVKFRCQKVLTKCGLKNYYNGYLSICCSNKKFLQDIQDTYLSKYSGKIHFNGGVWKLSYSKLSEVVEIFSWIYNGNFCLQRKKQEFDKILDFFKSKTT